ncbi:hypothetical protein LOTGIDRAFT_234939 [Lottia gigantea]|uniref:Fibrous sheath-interacting protein 1 n=1 Tax=Lottia gigantea TaxID=225164 RepID=V3Z9S0_LOTGI|nr:hypothetical protein LOTGIDRAFT_234939 [Lottia gigantea]ESO87693.1 hypothetical protein LOTGIDRAFT_234939 [Lottia gigantea]
MNLEDKAQENPDLALNLNSLGDNSEEFYVSSEGEYEYESEEEDDDVSITNSGILHDQSKPKTIIKPTSNAMGGTLVPYEEEEEIGSDEEKDLLRNIKDEIEQKVREEMKSELEMYKEKLKAIENGEILNKDENKTDDDLKDLDPKIRDGLLKMRKLDRILNKKVKREKEVKRERVLLERRMREEITELKSGGNREHKEVKSNTDKYLLLALPPSHNEGVIVDEPEVTPVFQTQIDESDLTKQNNEQDKSTTPENDAGESVSGDKKKKKKKKKDFIKRNKELAGQAEESIAMTEEERKRVADLLTDIETLPEEVDLDDSSIIMTEENPYQITVHCGDFLQSNIELRSLANIDSQLKHILPSDEYDSLVYTPVTQSRLFTRVDVKSSVLDFEKYGERSLIETKEQREMKEKLKHIEDELAAFHNPREMKLESPSLTGDQLNKLLDQCVRSMSRSSCVTDNYTLPDTTPQSEQTTSRSSIYDNPPVLSHDVLQKLLSEAYCPISTKLSSVAESEEYATNSDGELEPILAETWKLVAEAEIDDDKDIGKLTFDGKLTEDTNCDNSKPTNQYSQNIYSASKDSYKPEYTKKRPFLPEINKSPFLISQGLNNESQSSNRLKNSSEHSSIEIICNSLKDSSIVLESFSECGSESGDLTPTPGACDSRDINPVPRPPSVDRPSSSQSFRSLRTLTPS